MLLQRIMVPMLSKRLLVLAMSLLLFAAAAGHVQAQDPYAGKLLSYETDKAYEHVKVLRLGYSGLLSLSPGDALFIGDTIKTGADMRAKLELSDGTIISLAPASSIQIKGHFLDRAQGKRNSVLKAMKGTIRFVVQKLFRATPDGAETNWKNSQVTIETLNAVAGVRGTDFFCITGPDSTEFAVVEGLVNVRSATLSQRGDVPVGSNQISKIRKGGNPSPPALIAPARLDALVRSTSLQQPRSEAPSGRVAKQKLPRYTSKDMARDIASGMVLSDILDKAVESGMTIEEAVQAALDAGVPPALVVYTAIIEGYPVNLVVEAAVENGAPLAIVLSAAVAAGGDKALIIAGATDAGVPPAAVASTMAMISSNGSTLGGSMPVVVTPETVFPATAPPIGGGGGAPPSTQPASPYRP